MLAGTCPLLILIQEYMMYKEMTIAPAAIYDLEKTSLFKGYSLAACTYAMTSFHYGGSREAKHHISIQKSM